MKNHTEQPRINIRCVVLCSLLLPFLSFCDSLELQEAIDAFDNSNYHVAFEKFSLLANQGDTMAQNFLGFMYITGKGVPINSDTSLLWYRKAADQGCAHAEFSLGYEYFYGHGVGKSYDMAYHWYRKSADKGNSSAQNQLGFMYTKGIYVSQSYDSAFELYTKSADQGDAEAQYMVGQLYYAGQGVSQNYDSAYRWYLEAAAQGNADAQYCLGKMFDSGLSVHQNHADAVAWYRKAANLGSMEALIDPVDCYLNSKDTLKAIQTISDYLTDSTIKINNFHRAELLSKKSNIDFGMGNYKGAIEAITEAIKFDSANADYYDSKGWYCFWSGNWKEAKSSLETALKVDSTYKNTYYNLCDYYWAKEKNKKLALSCLEKAVQWELTDYEYKSLYDSTNDGHFLKGLNNTPEFKKILFKKIDETVQPNK